MLNEDIKIGEIKDSYLIVTLLTKTNFFSVKKNRNTFFSIKINKYIMDVFLEKAWKKVNDGYINIMHLIEMF